MCIRMDLRYCIPVIMIMFLGFLWDNETIKTSGVSKNFGIYFSFKGKKYALTAPMKNSGAGLFQRGGMSAAA